jgi:hypothetical protein
MGEENMAYRVLQGIFRKLTEEGLPASDTVSFTRRELAQLAGRQSFGGKQSQESELAPESWTGS